MKNKKTNKLTTNIMLRASPPTFSLTIVGDLRGKEKKE